MRLLVATLVATEQLSPDSEAAKEYAPTGKWPPRLKKFAADIRRLKAASEADYRSEALTVAKRWGCPIGIIHRLVGRKPTLSAGTHRTRRMRKRKAASERGQIIPKGDSWEHRPRRGKLYFLNGRIWTARLYINGPRQWPLKVIDEKETRALMAPVGAALERLYRAAGEVLNWEEGTKEVRDEATPKGDR
jgi:hypothetical protein